MVSEEDMKACEDLRRSQALSPFVVGGIIRVDGRLRITAVPYDARHPILFPCNHPVTILVIRPHYYEKGRMSVNHALTDINRTA